MKNWSWGWIQVQSWTKNAIEKGHPAHTHTHTLYECACVTVGKIRMWNEEKERAKKFVRLVTRRVRGEEEEDGVCRIFAVTWGKEGLVDRCWDCVEYVFQDTVWWWLKKKSGRWREYDGRRVEEVDTLTNPCASLASTSTLFEFLPLVLFPMKQIHLFSTSSSSPSNWSLPDLYLLLTILSFSLSPLLPSISIHSLTISSLQSNFIHFVSFLPSTIIMYTQVRVFFNYHYVYLTFFAMDWTSFKVAYYYVRKEDEERCWREPQVFDAGTSYRVTIEVDTAEFDTQLSHDTFPKMISFFRGPGTVVHCFNARLGGKKSLKVDDGEEDGRERTEKFSE